jgi:electron transport complex protein RnfB
LLDVEVLPLDAEEGAGDKVRTYASIREDECIGCTKCIQACPVDAILGSAKHMHTVITSECTGCDLCVEPCPVDCIDMLEVPTTLQTWAWDLPQPQSNIIATDATQGEAA